MPGLQDVWAALGLGGPSFMDRAVAFDQRQQERIRQGQGPLSPDEPDFAQAVDIAGAIGPQDLTMSPWAGLGLGGIIRAYQGSPAAPFAKYEDRFLGTGEGQNMYARGHFLAENPGVAEDYRRNLAAPKLLVDDQPVTRFDEMKIANQIANGVKIETRLGDLDSFIQTLERNIKKEEKLGGSMSGLYYGKLADAKREREQWASFQGRKVERQENPGTLFTTDVDVEPEDLLDWDAPLSKQPEKVRTALEGLGITAPKISGDWQSFSKLPGSEQLIDDEGIVQGFVFPLPNGKWQGTGPQGPVIKNTIEDVKSIIMKSLDLPGSHIYSKIDKDRATASRKLREAGIPGVRYLDAGSRDKGEGTRNLVMFDPELIKIIDAAIGGQQRR